MTSGTGPNRRTVRPSLRSRSRRGYTLLEICIVLFIIAMMVGAALPGLSGWLSEQRLRGPAGELELLARTARTTAIDRQQAFEIVLRRDALFLVPAGADPDHDSDPSLPPPYTLPDSVTLLTQAWGEAKFANRAETRWKFLPNGLCQPLQVKFTQGESEIALTFDPLTATISDEAYAFR